MLSKSESAHSVIKHWLAMLFKASRSIGLCGLAYRSGGRIMTVQMMYMFLNWRLKCAETVLGFATKLRRPKNPISSRL